MSISKLSTKLLEAIALEANGVKLQHLLCRLACGRPLPLFAGFLGSAIGPVPTAIVTVIVETCSTAAKVRLAYVCLPF